MQKKIGLVIVVLALAGGVSACSKSYGIPPGGPHFASASHMQYSLRGGEKPRLSRGEMDEARQEGWWGVPIRYTIDDLE
ncbi:MAG: hypothetical protein ACE5IQ_05380 [Candidatus Methylomirabilales bacterium]